MASRALRTPSVSFLEVLRQQSTFPTAFLDDVPYLVPSGKPVRLTDGMIEIQIGQRLPHVVRTWQRAQQLVHQGGAVAPIHVRYESGAGARVLADELRVPLVYFLSPSTSRFVLPMPALRRYPEVIAGLTYETGAPVTVLAVGRSSVVIADPEDEENVHSAQYIHPISGPDTALQLAAHVDRLQRAQLAVGDWWLRQPTLSGLRIGLVARSAPNAPTAVPESLATALRADWTPPTALIADAHFLTSANNEVWLAYDGVILTTPTGGRNAIVRSWRQSRALLAAGWHLTDVGVRNDRGWRQLAPETLRIAPAYLQQPTISPEAIPGIPVRRGHAVWLAPDRPEAEPVTVAGFSAPNDPFRPFRVLLASTEAGVESLVPANSLAVVTADALAHLNGIAAERNAAYVALTAWWRAHPSIASTPVAG